MDDPCERPDGTTLSLLTAPAPRSAPIGAQLFPRCASGATVDAASHGLADDLLDAGFELPSVYLLNGQRLRCHAARGYFQVVDGFRPGIGVIGRVVRDGVPVLVADVTAEPGFIAAVPGLVAEACAPVRCQGQVVGAVNLESRTRLPDDTLAVLTAAADTLGRTLQALGGPPRLSVAQRLTQIAVELTATSTVEAIEVRAVQAAVEISGMSSAALVHLDDGLSVVSRATGPLAPALSSWDSADLDVMASWVGQGTSSHFPGGEQVPAGYLFLHHAGVRAVSVHPLVSGGLLSGLLVVADADPVAHAPAVVDYLEMLAAQTAASLRTASVLRDERRRAEQDDLTGLPNRHGFARALARALDPQSPGGGTVAVLLLDLDDFKHVNDSLGHQAGDRLLFDVSRRLRAALPEDGTACRLGGDEFVVVLPHVDQEAAVATAWRLLAALSSVTVDGVDLGTTASIGIALTGTGDDSPEALLRAADLAMYLAKQRGKGRCTVFEPRLQTAAMERMALVRDLRLALREDRLTLAYQPVVDLGTGAVTAVEALVRWDDPVRGQVPPTDVIALAEETGDIRELGEWVLRTACAQLRAWTAAGADPGLAVCVNVSTRQLEHGRLAAVLDECLAAGLPASRIVLEITETALAQDSSAALATLHELRARGIALAVDDFGTGYSSLGRLRSAPVGQLKIDRSFVREIVGAQCDVPVVDAILAMARGLGLSVIAEGVETVEQLTYLRRRGCPEAQGYLLARPLPPDELLALVSAAPPWRELFWPPARAAVC